MNIILVIDDNEDYRTNFVEILVLEAYSILEAGNGLKGLQMIRQHFPALIVCDIDLPLMSGIEVLKAVKSDPIYTEIPFIIITGHRDDETVKIARDLGVNAYLTKPVPTSEFLSTIVHFLNKQDSALLK